VIWVEVAVALVVIGFTQFLALLLNKKRIKKNAAAQAMALTLALIAGLLPLVLAILVGIKTGRAAQWFSAKHLLEQIKIGVLLGMALVAVFSLLTVLLARLTKTRLSNMTATRTETGSQLRFGIIYTLIFVGPDEEIVFRGYFLSLFLAATGSAIFAVTLSTAMFAAIHYSGRDSWSRVGIAVVIGVIFATALLKIPDCTILSVALAHGLFDAGAYTRDYIFRRIDNAGQ
jgi:membrane protease YdiL (CAAX protease family)